MQLVLCDHPGQHVVDAFVDSSLAEALLALAGADAAEGADGPCGALTPGARTALARTLQRLAPRLPAALAAQAAGLEERIDLTGPDPDEPARGGAKRKLA